MQYLKYTYVDSQTGIPVTDAPARNGPAAPAVTGLTFDFALESEYPTEVPSFYGTAPDDADCAVPGVLDLLTEAEYAAAEATEWHARRVKMPAITPRQIRLALTQMGQREAVEAAVAAGDQDLKDWWEFSLGYERMHPLVIAMADGLGMTPGQVDDLWRLGATL